MPDGDRPLPHVPDARTVGKRRTRPSLVWIIPVVAALAGVWVAVTRILAEGPTITIVFPTAEGLEAGKTKIHYKGVGVGTLTEIRLSDDHQHVIATAQMAPKSESFLVEGTQFWVVSPRISGATVSGLGTLISGAYIGMEIGTSRKKRRDFVALAAPPVVTGNVPGRTFVLKTADLGSLDYGTPIYFRRLEVGRVVSYQLEQGGQSFSVRVFVRAPYDRYVNPETRFWHASGVDLSLTASGLSVQTQSLLSILVGGIAFETPTSAALLPPAEADTVFHLFRNWADATKPVAHDPQTYLLVFKQSVRGLAVGAPVEFRGIQIGEVAEIRPEFDAKTLEFAVFVIIRVDPSIFGVTLVGASDADLARGRRERIDAVVARGLRAQLRTGSLLTGALYVSLDFVPDALPAAVDWSLTPPRVPTAPGELEGIEARVASIIKKVDEMPIKAIGDDLAKAIVELDQTLASARQTLDSADRLVAPNSALSTELGSALQEMSRAMRGLRVLADYLERHPEALLRGKAGKAEE